ncbi:hypothetical protein RJP21_08735 [Paenibacillus sp. VCA1]|uniref:hypothetical protein n=1 Tax=Paenibacillus sp. VCA1 TaxID=3039148 RepID=UPI0028726A74|nr:hypothetical protein [Paenibacillus sp. VCA1]MDR9853685.1 hypothetical protein [Paenibacillus sp. VCA1]
MDSLEQFYKKNCELIDDNLVLLKTDFEKIQINVNDNTYCEFRYLHLKNLVRFLNPKLNLNRQSTPQISNDELEMEDLDQALEMVATMEAPAEKIDYKSMQEMLPLYFLPSHIEREIKNITCGNKRRRIDHRIKKILPETFIESLNLQFAEKQDEEVIINYDLRAHHSISFFKFYKNDEYNECVDPDEIEKKVNEVKYKLNLKFVESMEHYFVGNIDIEIGLFERDEHEHSDNPLYYHFNLWKLDGRDLGMIVRDFSLYPFNKEVIESEHR